MSVNSASLDGSSLLEGNDEASELDWEEELKQQKEIAELEANFDTISDAMKSDFRVVLDVQSVNQRMLIYRMLGSLDWSNTACHDLLGVLQFVPKDRFIDMTNILKTFRSEILSLFISIFSSMTMYQIDEILNVLDLDTIHKLMEIARHLLPDPDIDYMKRLIMELSISEVINILDSCNEPMAKHCRLCRTRRMRELEFRMNNKQIPEGVKMLPGMVETYHQPEVWQANDDLGFEFDIPNGLVFWRGTQVDMMKICDKCIVDVHNASVTDTHFEEYHHLFGQERKDYIASLKGREQDRALLVYKLSFERVRRRAREFSLMALAKQRHGLTQENLKRISIEKEIKRKNDHEKKIIDKEVLIQNALKVEKKWIQEEQKVIDKNFVDKTILTQLNYLPEYGVNNGIDNNHVSTEREHPLSWRLSNVTNDGIPLTEQRAANRFGYNDIEPETFPEQLKDWNQTAQNNHQKHLERLAEIARRKREREIKLHGERVEYVDERLKEIRRAEQLKQREAERAEELRLEQRAADRLIRRATRIAKLEAAERELMAIDDDIAYQMRIDRNNAILIAVEFEGMRRAEIAQTRIDAFWGIPTHQEKLRKEAERLEQEYQDKVNKMHKLCIVGGIVKAPEPEPEPEPTDEDDYY